MKCNSCGNWNDPGNKQCANCGTALSKKTCSQGHTIPPTLQDCPWCPKPGTQVESSLQGGGGGPAFSNAGAKRSGTMILGAEALPAGGGLGAPAPIPGAPAPAPAGGGRRGRTMVVGAGQQGMGVPAPSPGGSLGAAASSGSRGTSPLAGFLVSFSGDANGVFWPLRMGRTRLGSAEDCDIQLTLEGISSQHANINVHDNKGQLKIWITDQDSMNGTRVNGDSIFNEKPDLTHGDVIGIGDVDMKIILLPS